MNKIPGKLKAEDIPQLIELVDGKCVLCLGCYCGRGLITLARHARKVWVLDDFKYPGGIEGVVAELKSNIDRHVPDDKEVNLLHGTPASWGVPPGSEDLCLEEVEVVYRDANRSGTEEEQDMAFALVVLKGRGGVFAWHNTDHDLKWLQINPVPVETN